jgi:hypothetical protein
MEQQEAEQALAIVRKVIQSTREDLIAHNWGLIWMFHAFTNLAAFASVGIFVERRGMPIVWYLVPLAIVAVVDLGSQQLLISGNTGVRSFVQWQVQGIWTTFIVFSVVVALALYLAHASPRLYCPILATTSGIGFAMMGVVFYRRFLAFAALFMLVIVLAPLFPELQWILLGLAWWVALFVSGLGMHLERRHRMQDETAAAIL